METLLKEIQVSSFTQVAGYSFMSTSPILLLTLFFSNNSIEVNLLECTEKENFQFDKLDQCHSTETESATGRVAAQLQEKTVKLLQRRR